MIHAPLKGLLHVWGELVLALHGVNGFGGNVAEIYAYPLEASDPTFAEKTRRWLAADRSGAMPINYQPIESLRQLLLLFRDTYECDIAIDGYPIGDGYMPPTNHRWHIAISRRRS